MKTPHVSLQGLGIGTMFLVAAAGVTILFKPALAGFGHPRQAPRAEPATRIHGVTEKPATLPPDFLDLCRAAGL